MLFLCTGNYYRSRYAEEVFNHHARIEGLAWSAFSRGVAEKGAAANVGPMSRFALAALQAKGIVPAGIARFPQPCSPADFDRGELVIALKEAEHRPMIERRFPDVASRITYWHVDDIEFTPPAEALTLIDAKIAELVAALAARK